MSDISKDLINVIKQIASSSNTVGESGLNDELDRLINILIESLIVPADQRSGTAIKFDKDSVYGTIGTPETGNITYSAVDAKLGVVALVIHNKSGSPTFGSNMVKTSVSEDYASGELNYIYIQYINATKILYTIVQEA